VGVRNDVTLAGAGRALLVTGSNMSGKSTLLRSVGLAAVMAQAGLPVRATKLRLASVQVATCMRVTDSLQQGASFFLAEVLRLRRVVELAQGPLPVLFLLDEILQGTNTRERSLGARGVVRLLVARGASGLVSTHDLSLVRLGDVLGDRLAYAHFTDRVEDGRMVFDYRMHDGVVQGSNALRVMRANGLDVELAADDDAV
jgi:DNA mismatch repair ATPase MutS